MGYNNTPNVIVQIDNKAIREQQEKADRQTQVINQGTSLITADQTTPLDIQLEGRTLVPLQNTNLAEGSFVLANADKKTKLLVDNKVSAGVAKFTKNSPVSRRTSFAGKVQGSTVENPHSAFTILGTTLGTPSSSVGKFDWNTSQISYDQIMSLNGTSKGISSTTNGYIAQTLFSFDLITEIERNMGRIPGADTAAKVQWLKDNLLNADVKWYGFGSGPAGNKASLSVWGANLSSWVLFASHTSGAVTLIQGYTNSAGSMASRIDSNGFIHFLAHSEPTDGVTPAVVATDFIELLIDVKSTAQLDSRPMIIRSTNYEGKTQGNTDVNPHIAKASAVSTDLTLPSGSWSEFQNGVNDGALYSYAPTVTQGGAVTRIDAAVATPGRYPQMMFSFDLIAETERNLGRIPKTTLADKIAWLKANIQNLQLRIRGYGTGPNGNKMTVARFNVGGNSWSVGSNSTHTNGTHTLLTPTVNLLSGIGGFIDNNGFVHFLAYGEPSSASVISSLFVDHVEFEYEFLPGAVLHDPQIPLYSVDSTEYTKILGEWPEVEVLNRYPKAAGIQHVQNPYIMAEGENLLPPFYEWDDMSSGKATILEPYKVMLSQAVAGQRMTIYIPAIEGQTYTFSANKDTGNGLVYFYFCDASKGRLVGGITHRSGTAPAGTKLMEVIVNPDAPLGDYGFSNPMMTLGPVEKPFTPKNPSYLFTQVKLGQVGSTKDSLYKQDGWKVRKAIEKDVTLDALSFVLNAVENDHTRIRFFLPNLANTNGGIYQPIATKYDGSQLKYEPSKTNAGLARDNMFITDITGVSNFYVGIPKTDSGWSHLTYQPTVSEITAFTYGWQAKTVDANGKPNSWRSLGDGTDAPTQTLAYVSANKAPNFTPYKVSYILATPLIEDVSDKIEGDISVNGITQVEVGSGVIVREKVTPQLNGDGTYKIGLAPAPLSLTKHRVGKFLKVYVNGVQFNNYTVIYNSLTYGNERITIQAKDYDPAGEYKVTYLALDRDKLTVNPYNVKTTYAKNIRSALEDTIKKVEDNTKDISINVQAVAELYRRMKSMGG